MPYLSISYGLTHSKRYVFCHFFVVMIALYYYTVLSFIDIYRKNTESLTERELVFPHTFIESLYHGTCYLHVKHARLYRNVRVLYTNVNARKH